MKVHAVLLSYVPLERKVCLKSVFSMDKISFRRFYHLPASTSIRISRIMAKSTSSFDKVLFLDFKRCTELFFFHFCPHLYTAPEKFRFAPVCTLSSLKSISVSIMLCINDAENTLQDSCIWNQFFSISRKIEQSCHDPIPSSPHRDKAISTLRLSEPLIINWCNPLEIYSVREPVSLSRSSWLQTLLPDTLQLFVAFNKARYSSS